MAFTIYQASVPVYLRHLAGLSAILDKAAAHCAARKIDPAALLQARLYPDMFAFVRQVQSACNHAVRGTARLTGIEPMSTDGGDASFDDLKALVARTVAFVSAATPESMRGAEDREVTFPIGGGKTMTLTGAEYLLHYSVPNFYFHATTSYDILRHNGVEIGKADFMGPVA